MLVSKICLTGGPCAGKTTVLKLLKEKLKNDNYEVITINEKATELILEKFCDPTDYQNFNGEIFKREIIDEFKAEEKARLSDKKYVIITDRGLLDNVGYAGKDIMSKIFKKFDLTFEDANNNYDLVIHMYTAAKDNPEGYNLESNETRYETVEEAIFRDTKLLEAWENHYNRKTVSTQNNDFNSKLNTTIELIEEHLKNQASRSEEKYINLYNVYKKINFNLDTTKYLD